jgi:hypothetical protein
MKRVGAYAVGLVVLLLVVFAPVAFFDAGTAGDEPDPTTIASYVADFTVADTGELTATETLTVRFPGGRHGIFRFWDEADPSAPHARRVPHDIDVTLDGAAVPVEQLDEGHGRYTVAKIGSTDEFVPPGEHVYVVDYTVDGVLEPGTDGTRSQLYWNLVPGGWGQRIESTDLTVRLPAAAEGVRCAVGAGRTTGCTARGDGSDTVRVTTGPLEARTPVTLKVGLDLAPPPAAGEVAWPARFDPVLGRSLPVLLIVVLLALGAAALGLALAARAREPRPQYPLMYAPPEGIGPAQASYLLTERVDRTAYVASLMQAAENGAIDLDRHDGVWSVIDLDEPDGWAGLDPVTCSVAHLLGGPGTTFTASSKDAAAGQRLQSEIKSFQEGTRTWARQSGHMTGSGLGSAGALVVIAALAAALALAIWNPLDLSVLALVPGALGVFALPLLLPGSGTRRTRSGRELWSRVGGFRRVLATPSSEERFDFSGRKELYTAYIPWAVAFDCADEWADKYRTETVEEPPVPAYFAGAYAGNQSGNYVDSMVDDFSSTMDGAISSYQATQTSSSSSGGGGFSGGGGGGGGGGGSW